VVSKLSPDSLAGLANAAAGNYELKVTNPDGGTGSAALKQT